MLTSCPEPSSSGASCGPVALVENLLTRWTPVAVIRATSVPAQDDKYDKIQALGRIKSLPQSCCASAEHPNCPRCWFSISLRALSPINRYFGGPSRSETAGSSMVAPTSWTTGHSSAERLVHSGSGLALIENTGRTGVSAKPPARPVHVAAQSILATANRKTTQNNTQLWEGHASARSPTQTPPGPSNLRPSFWRSMGFTRERRLTRGYFSWAPSQHAHIPQLFSHHVSNRIEGTPARTPFASLRGIAQWPRDPAPAFHKDCFNFGELVANSNGGKPYAKQSP
jgi:hypothetical protein